MKGRFSIFKNLFYLQYKIINQAFYNFKAFFLL